MSHWQVRVALVAALSAGCASTPRSPEPAAPPRAVEAPAPELGASDPATPASASAGLMASLSRPTPVVPVGAGAALLTGRKTDADHRSDTGAGAASGPTGVGAQPLTQADLEAPFLDSKKLDACVLPPAMRVSVTALIYDGNASKVDARAEPRDARAEACVENVVLKLAWEKAPQVSHLKVRLPLGRAPAVPASSRAR